MRYLFNVSFVKKIGEERKNIAEKFKTFREAESYSDIIDDTVERALIKDTVTGRVTWLKDTNN